MLPQKSCRHKISIHALREEGDTSSPTQIQHITIFLSTPSARRATIRKVALVHALRISIHALREEGDYTEIENDYKLLISIHALREEGDLRLPWRTLPSFIDFYPRPPRGGRPCVKYSTSGNRENFYPRPPRGGRLDEIYHALHDEIFLSTPSARRATRNVRTDVQRNAISIHALREEGDDIQSEIESYADISIHALREEGDGRLCQSCINV